MTQKFSHSSSRFGLVAMISALTLPAVLAVPSATRFAPMASAAGPTIAALPPAEAPPATEKLLNVRNSGVRGDGVTDDTDAIQRAIDAAIAANATAYFPQGTYLVQAGGGPGIRLSDGAKLRGTGPGSLIQAVDNPTDSGNMFSMPRGQKSSVSFTDIAIQGPSNVPEEITVHSIYHQGTGGTVQFRRVKMFGRSVAIKAGGIAKMRDDIILDIQDCDLAGKHCVLQPGTGTCYARNTDFHDFGGGAESNKYHALYLYHGVTVDVENCRFYSQVKGSLGCAITMHNSLVDRPPGAPEEEMPKYARIVNCTFDPSIYMAVKTNSVIRTLVSGCTFQNRVYSVVLQNDADILKCNFSNAVYAVSGYGGGGGAGGAAKFTSKALIQDCNFAQNRGLLVNYNNTNSEWTFQHCKFASNIGAAFPRVLSDGRAAGGIRLLNCWFPDSPSYATSTIAPR